MASKDAPAPDIMNVREIIEFAFGDFEKNTVNFKLVQTILFLIARQLRLLERRVIVEMGPLTILPSDTTLSVTEVKIHAAQKTQTKMGGSKPGAAGPKYSAVGGKAEGGAGARASAGTGAGGKRQKKGRGTQFTSSDKTTTDKTTSADKNKGSKTTSSGENTPSDKTTASGGKTSTDRTISSGEKTATDETTSTSTTTDKPLSKTTLLDRTSTTRTTLPSKDAAGGQKPNTYPDILDILEEQRERELRIIHQRTDSFEETTKTPTPMASVTSMQYEKLLVVKKVPSSETRLGENVHGRTPQISVVTQEQFNQVADAVRHLEKKLLPAGTPGFPEKAELMEELRRGASLTDAMAALQLSARLEATEKTLANLISMIAELALQTPGVEIDSETRVVLGISATKQKDSSTLEAGEVFEGDLSESGLSVKRRDAKKSKSTSPLAEISFAISEAAETEMTQALKSASGTAPVEGGPSTTAAPEAEATESAPNRFITHPDLQRGTKEMYDEVIKKLKAITARTSTTAENAYKLAMKLERRLESALLDTSRMVDLENAVKQYAEQINALDTGLSSQMTNYQEQLTQMQHDLEVGLDTMTEVLANSGGDTEAMAELHSHFTNLQMDFEMISFRQQELKGAQNSTAYDLENLWREIEMLRDTKSDREEVADALRDKAGISELNGLVSLQQFEAVRSDFQKRIRAAYDKFNNQETIWQKAIEDIIKVLNEKADLAQVYSLKDEIQKYLNKIKDRMQIITDIVGEPKSAMLSKKVFRDTLCLSCGSPAHMDVEEPGKVPALPKFPSARQPAEGAEAESQPKGGGDYGVCYPGLPIPHPRDPRSHICKRYCGGSHTVVTDGLSRALPGLVVLQTPRTSNAAPGTDGKLYLTDEQTKKIPCLPCRMTQTSTTALEPEPQIQADCTNFQNL